MDALGTLEKIEQAICLAKFDGFRPSTNTDTDCNLWHYCPHCAGCFIYEREAKRCEAECGAFEPPYCHCIGCGDTGIPMCDEGFCPSCAMKGTCERRETDCKWGNYKPKEIDLKALFGGYVKVETPVELVETLTEEPKEELK